MGYLLAKMFLDGYFLRVKRVLLTSEHEKMPK